MRSPMSIRAKWMWLLPLGLAKDYQRSINISLEKVHDDAARETKPKKKNF